MRTLPLTESRADTDALLGGDDGDIRGVLVLVPGFPSSRGWATDDRLPTLIAPDKIAHPQQKMPTTIAILGTFDSKGPEHAFIAAAMRRAGFSPLLIDVGSLDAPTITPDITRTEVLVALNSPEAAAILARRDRGECVTLMGRAAAALITSLHLAGRTEGNQKSHSHDDPYEPLIVWMTPASSRKIGCIHAGASRKSLMNSRRFSVGRVRFKSSRRSEAVCGLGLRGLWLLHRRSARAAQASWGQRAEGKTLT